MKTKVINRLGSDQATEDSGKVRLGDMAPAFTDGGSEAKTVARDTATEDGGKVRLGDMAPLF
jgi:hypothetical protein